MTQSDFAKKVFDFLRPDCRCNAYSLFYNRWNRSKKLHSRLKTDDLNAWLIGCYYCGLLSLDTLRDLTPIQGRGKAFDLEFAKELMYSRKFTYRQLDELRRLALVAKNHPTWQSLKTFKP